ncbi:hypothetical protein ElyMa_000800800 [Elysia marginata]|uniref:Uncharacterized protein n=1 Tax=Elysia marginata TaxID=1093978 RepID=A0AAV4GXA2_9GAST|nr:hypothetical protein ElyMa_000800800 [Elysia marginata]
MDPSGTKKKGTVVGDSEWDCGEGAVERCLSVEMNPNQQNTGQYGKLLQLSQAPDGSERIEPIIIYENTTQATTSLHGKGLE